MQSLLSTKNCWGLHVAYNNTLDLNEKGAKHDKDDTDETAKTTTTFQARQQQLVTTPAHAGKNSCGSMYNVA